MIEIEEKPQSLHTLSEKPCTILPLQSFDAFIIGTYELLDLTAAKKLSEYRGVNDDELKDKLKEANNRFGSLNLFEYEKQTSEYSLTSSIRCPSGIFDAVLTDKQPRSDHGEQFIIALANGTIGYYEVNASAIRQIRHPVRVVEDASLLLTCIDCISDRLFFIVGDSSGNITLSLSNSDISNSPDAESYELIKTQVCEDPIWQVKLVSWTIPKSFEESIQIVVAAENCCWYIYRFDDEKRKLVQLFKNNDFRAGITSLCLRVDSKLSSFLRSIRLFIGSYDSTIREYQIDLDENDGSLVVSTCASLELPGAGIWRIDFVPCRGDHLSSSQDFDVLNVATMYENPCRIFIPSAGKNATLPHPLDKGKLEQISRLHCDTQNQEDPLYYGFMQSRWSSNHCLIDFNNRLCIFLKNLKLN